MVAAISLFNILAYRQAYSMMHFTRGGYRTGEPAELSFGAKIEVLFNGVNIPRPHTKLQPTSLSPDCKVLTIPETNGITLGAWYNPAPPENPLIILFHGYMAEKAGTLPEARIFSESGCSVLMVDFRGSGESSESYTTIGYQEAEDVAAAVTYAREHLKFSKLILYGQSMGASAILRAVDKYDVHPDGIIIESVFDRMLTTVQHRFEAMHVPSFPGAQLLIFWGGHQSGFDGFSHNPVDYAAGIRCPALFLHGAADPKARIGEAKQVYEGVPGFKQFHEFEGGGHASGAGRFAVEWKQAVLKFFQDSGIQAAS